eukprot:1671038-Alexandrium_andersonii.AAC.1
MQGAWAILQRLTRLVHPTLPFSAHQQQRTSAVGALSRTTGAMPQLASLSVVFLGRATRSPRKLSR